MTVRAHGTWPRLCFCRWWGWSQKITAKGKKSYQGYGINSAQPERGKSALVALSSPYIRGEKWHPSLSHLTWPRCTFREDGFPSWCCYFSPLSAKGIQDDQLGLFMQLRCLKVSKMNPTPCKHTFLHIYVDSCCNCCVCKFNHQNCFFPNTTA